MLRKLLLVPAFLTAAAPAFAQPAITEATIDPTRAIGLTPDQREVVTLRFVADLAIEEVARITGRPIGAVKALQHRALRALASTLTTEPQLSRNPLSGTDVAD